MDLRLGIRKYWTDRSVKLLSVWFGPDFRVASLTEKWTERKLPLENQANMANSYIAFVTLYGLIAVPCPGNCMIRLERLGLFSCRKDAFQWSGSQAIRLTSGQVDRRSGGQAIRRTGGQADMRSGGQYWLLSICSALNDFEIGSVCELRSYDISFCSSFIEWRKHGNWAPGTLNVIPALYQWGNGSVDIRRIIGKEVCRHPRR